MDYADFTLGPKEEAQLKIGWVPQNGTPLRENVYVKFGKLKTQMVFIGTCKLPKSMTQNQVLMKSHYNYFYLKLSEQQIYATLKLSFRKVIGA